MPRRSGHSSGPGEAAGDSSPTKVRLDLWLWAVRVYRTRPLAQEACQGGHVKINGAVGKPSSPVRVGDEISARTGGGGRTERLLIVRELRTVRTGAPEAATAYEDHSPPPPPRLLVPALPVRERGSGRPTKRERREIDRLRGR